MSLSHFRSYQLAVTFYRKASKLHLPPHLRMQLDRAASSVALNLAEGSGKQSPAEQKRFYFIALGSLRECQAILDLAVSPEHPIVQAAHELGGCVYRLCFPR